MAESAVKGDAYPSSHGPQPGAAHACLRVLLFVSTLISVVVAVTSKQTVSVTVAGIPFPVPLPAKFTQSPAFIYLVAAMSVACLYSLITALAALTFVAKKPVSRARSLLFLLISDAVMLALVASATGTAGGVGYIAWKGNRHAGWTKICNVYETFCHHVAGFLGVSLFAGLVLLVLVSLSAHSFHGCIPK
ncbi:hypothetical protein MLD38_038864 [Melastoma candidum]|uniref:Uncharacterized protein n=1 Tax=Melastoma candidum TaxID=119954 RepID=A0ACB9L107_9MYRT|nr:hypothetical protein MLD38_038864 [Melastoma candidum]